MPTNYDIEYPKLQQKCQRLQARVEALEGIVTEAVGVCDDLIEKTDVYLGINDAYERHDLWEKRVQALSAREQEKGDANG